MNPWAKMSDQQKIDYKLRISNTLRRKGIRPPSNKGKKFTPEHVAKIIQSKRENGSLYHTRDRTNRIMQSRKEHYDRIGRKSTLVARLKRTTQYVIWRKNVFERDNFTCVLCSKKGGYLEADHIIPKVYYIAQCEYNYDRCLECKSLWDIVNGRTLCRACHIKTPTFANGAKKYI